MAYYTGKQVFLFTLGGIVLTVALILGTKLLEGPTETVSLADENRVARETPDLSKVLETNSGEIRTQQIANTSGYSDDEQNNIDIYAQYSDAVVNISTEVISYDFFFEPTPTQGGTGSGSIIDKRGYILTNNHVVAGANKLYVTLSNGERLEAKVIGIDAENDIAVVKIEPGERVLKTITIGASAGLKVGQKVIAIGNPFSLDRTMTTGIVSALGRPIKSGKNLIIQNMIQTDASINPGNSGGPLLDRKGNLIGINTMIYSESGGSVGIGFAVPADTAKRVVPELLKYGQVKRGWIDIMPIQVFPELVQYARLSVESGILVSQVDAGGLAETAGIKGGQKDKAVRYGRTLIYLGGDIITQVDGQEVSNIADLYRALEDNKPGDKVKVVFYRGSKKMETIVQLEERPNTFTIE